MSTSSRRVALFVTCLVDQLMPEIGVAAVRLLRHAGYAVNVPLAQTCCGQPFFNSGFAPEAAAVARSTLDTLSTYGAVVLPSGSCAAFMRQEYAHLFEDDPARHAQALDLAARTYELSEFLVEQAGWEPPKLAHAPRVTYHDSCHANRFLRLGPQARHLLTTAGCELVEMTESDRCCGFGGVFSVKMPEVSNAMTQEKLRQAANTQTDLLVSIDPGCLMQLRGWADQTGVRPVHLATVLAEALP